MKSKNVGPKFWIWSWRDSREIYKVKTWNAILSLCDNVGLIGANNGYSKRQVFASSKWNVIP